MSRMTMVLMLMAGMLLIGAGVSGFVSDAEVSSARLGSDFDDSRYHNFDDFSPERGQQRTRRQQIGLEVVGGIGLMAGGMFFFTPKRKASPAQRAGTVPASFQAAPDGPVRVLPATPARLIQERYATFRRRPDGTVHVQPKGGA